MIFGDRSGVKGSSNYAHKTTAAVIEPFDPCRPPQRLDGGAKLRVKSALQRRTDRLNRVGATIHAGDRVRLRFEASVEDSRIPRL